ncbi:hypothetical protein F2P81_001062 [Scophthalmus maximus]|uniref:Uncharacterized protein n=1 Tax=Scophthalmus maximus TaxID=52904 RepID=A0A6A4TRC0_SCOMX|nr:hypothetical protein F2P81_001062 [Scophthalmus maximus]
MLSFDPVYEFSVLILLGREIPETDWECARPIRTVGAPAAAKLICLLFGNPADRCLGAEGFQTKPVQRLHSDQINAPNETKDAINRSISLYLRSLLSSPLSHVLCLPLCKDSLCHNKTFISDYLIKEIKGGEQKDEVSLSAWFPLHRFIFRAKLLCKALVNE